MTSQGSCDHFLRMYKLKFVEWSVRTERRCVICCRP